MNRALAVNDVIVFSKKSHICFSEANASTKFKFKVSSFSTGSENGNKNVVLTQVTGSDTSFETLISKGMNVFIFQMNSVSNGKPRKETLDSNNDKIKVWNGNAFSADSPNDYFLDGISISSIITNNDDVSAAFIVENDSTNTKSKVLFQGVNDAYVRVGTDNYKIQSDIPDGSDFKKGDTSPSGVPAELDDEATSTPHHLNTLVDKSFFSFASSEDEEQEISRDTTIADALTGHIDALLVKVERKISEHEDDQAYVCQARDNVIRQSEAGYGNLESQRLRAKMKLEMKICNIEEQIAYLDICIKAN
jgi:hypothetical protein